MTFCQVFGAGAKDVLTLAVSMDRVLCKAIRVAVMVLRQSARTGEHKIKGSHFPAGVRDLSRPTQHHFIISSIV